MVRYTDMNTLNSRAERKIRQLLACLLAITCLTALLSAEATDSQSQNSIVALNQDPDLTKELLDALAEFSPDYVPRTEHINPDGSPVYLNRLVRESSPYLIQHAHNPVNWYPWGEEAFKAAKDQNKPVFLSIGYATCHWCHVMERESFEDVAIAEILNDNFIAIKVDREQLPDVDALYMTSVMMIAGNGGWPMSSWLDAGGRPFYGGTYFPPEHFTQLLNRISDLWQNDNAVLMQQADQVSAAMNNVNKNKKAAHAFGLAEMKVALAQALGEFDEINGGFGTAPKFPRESTLFFLLDQAQRQSNENALNIADSTLNHMANGGIHDHIAGGFHRYAVDSRWLVPHFEKMLYNQAALSRNYAQAWQLTGDINHKRTATRIFDYVLREMRNSDGLFYSATDADSEGEEGRFFIWTPEEIDELLGEDANLAKQIWNITGEGSFEGDSIIHLNESIAQIAEQKNMTTSALLEKIDSWSKVLLDARQSREKPLLDNKVLTSWNGMMITALAEGSVIFNNDNYRNAASTAADALWQVMRKNDQGLYRSYYEGQASIEGTQPDYAFFAESLIALYDATGNPTWLNKAITLTDEMHNRFWDTEDGAYFMGADKVSGTKLTIRPKDLHDNATPTGNSVAMRVLSKLFKRTGEPRFETRADELIVALSGSVSSAPSGFYYFLLGANEHLFGESGSQQYAARGRVSAVAKIEDDQVKVKVNIAPGWHINSNNPIQDYLIATRLTLKEGKELKAVSYPAPIEQSLSFDKSVLSLFEGELDIQAPYSKDGDTTFELQLQACDDKRCLPPETITLRTSQAASG